MENSKIMTISKAMEIIKQTELDYQSFFESNYELFSDFEDITVEEGIGNLHFKTISKSNDRFSNSFDYASIDLIDDFDQLKISNELLYEYCESIKDLHEFPFVGIGKVDEKLYFDVGSFYNSQGIQDIVFT